MFIDQSDLQFACRLGMAVLLGSVIGLERQYRQRMAGLRTNTLVSAGAASFVMLSQYVPNNGDQTHVLAYVVSGIGFLGAGVIMKEGLAIRGLNTAATLWCAASVGAIAGFGFGFKASILTIAILITNIGLRPVAHEVNFKINRRQLARAAKKCDDEQFEAAFNIGARKRT